MIRTTKIQLEGTPEENRKRLLECSVELYAIDDRKLPKEESNKLFNEVASRYGKFFVMATMRGIVDGHITRKEVDHFKDTGELHYGEHS